MEYISKIVKVKVNDIIVSYTFDGATQIGNDKFLLSKDTDLTKDTNWEHDGYVVDKFINNNSFEILTNYISELIAKTIIEKKIKIDSNFTLENYHNYISNDIQHMSILSSLNANLPTNKLPFINEIIYRISEICKNDLTTLNPYTLKNIFNIRIIRPNKKYDNNPPHKDVYINRLRNAINIYVPIAGSDKKSSIALIPNSHKSNENEIQYSKSGAIINNKKFTVPAIVSYKNNELEMIRPNPLHNEVLVFSPYIIHGGGYNLNIDKTRISLEIRLWKKNWLKYLFKN